MRKIIFLTALMMMILSATAFAEEVTEPSNETDAEPYIYTSKDFEFTIACPFKPVAVVQNPWQEPEKRGEMLVFANEGFDIKYAYLIQVNAFDNESVPDFNKADKKTLDEYLAKLTENGGFGSADLVNISSANKGILAVTAETIQVMNQETGEVEGEFVADRRDIYTYFRTPQGRCIGIQLISVSLDKEFVDVYRYGVASFKDNSAFNNKKSDKKDKKAKKDKKDKKDKK